MAKLRLTDADRERLGCPEFLPFEPGSLTNREAIELRKLGYKTPVKFWDALRAERETDGDQVVDVVLDYVAWTALVWLALRRVGIQSDPATLEFDVDGLQYVPNEEPAEEEPGKAPAVPDPSTSSEPTS